MALFYGWSSTVARLQSHYEEAVYFFTTKSPGVPGTHFIHLGRRKVESTLEPLGDFEPGTNGLGTQQLNH